MCTKSPVREIATIEGTSIHRRLTNYHNRWGKWALSNYLQYEIHLRYYTYFPLLIILIFPGEKNIKIKKCFVCPFSARVPNLLLNGPVL